MLEGDLTGMGVASMQVDIEECYRLAAEARRPAEMPGMTSTERADLLEVERRWLSLARGSKDNERLNKP
jgi:hypothetical protein